MISSPGMDRIGIWVMEPFFPLIRPGALVQRRQVGVHVPWVATTAGNFLTGGADLSQRLAVVGDIGQDDQHVVSQLVGEVLGGGQRQTRA